jgi:hypothetical protein
VLVADGGLLCVARTVKSLVNYTVRSKNGSGVRPLLALSFMFMDRTDKQQLLIDADGLSLLFEVSHSTPRPSMLGNVS